MKFSESIFFNQSRIRQPILKRCHTRYPSPITRNNRIEYAAKKRKRSNNKNRRERKMLKRLRPKRYEYPCERKYDRNKDCIREHHPKMRDSRRRKKDRHRINADSDDNSAHDAPHDKSNNHFKIREWRYQQFVNGTRPFHNVDRK